MKEHQFIERSMTFTEYISLLDRLLLDGKTYLDK